MKYANIKYNCASSGGPGVQTCLFVSGCNLHCHGCFNKEAQDFGYGEDFTEEVLKKLLDSVEPEYISGLSILGGEPMDEKNQECVSHIIDEFRTRYQNRKMLCLWTGYVLNKVPTTDFTKNILKKVDMIVDGPFLLNKSGTNLQFRGSSNQRILMKGLDF